MVSMAYLPITEYGLIGDLHTAALVGGDGRLVWLPWPRFDSPSLFSALLDDRRGGDWLLAPTEIVARRQAYDGETAILVTTFETPTGTAELWDWMSPWDGVAGGHDLCRMLRCTAGEVEVECRFAPRPDYARSMPELSIQGDHLTLEAHELTLHLACKQEWQIADGSATFQTRLRQNEEIGCVLSSGAQIVPVTAIAADLEATRRFWQNWISNCTYTGRWSDAVRRSAITLKLLTYAPSGAIIAAPTTSLPEWIGGPRNWDYRYTWLRDASLTLDALCELGYHEEEANFFSWLDLLAKKFASPLQIMYGVGGETELTEEELDHLEGYRGSRPVRIGNAAFSQRQLDAYGGVIDAAYAFSRHRNVLTEHEWSSLRDEIDYVCSHWSEPDQGIWEMRGPPAQHTFSKLMCWVTLDRGVKLAENEGWQDWVDRWTETRDEIRESILEHAWKEDVGAFTMTYDSSALDASLLVLPRTGFLAASDKRIRSTVMRIKDDLSRGALVYRYRTDDSLPGDEGAFLLCSFWLVEALAAIGEVDEAMQRFETLLSYTSTHHLLSEEVDPDTGTALGNYPQAFSHIGLINCALSLSQKLPK
ncbi:MAG TPA: glycoside hydrolase family 15 protein [Herpetosiphonaceae bacterium]